VQHFFFLQHFRLLRLFSTGNESEFLLKNTTISQEAARGSSAAFELR
jgi:hypothetical protein